jgi:hypothetical protein
MQHQEPAFITNPCATPDSPVDDWLIQLGHRRVVHSQRARKLRKRGVPVWPMPRKGEWYWCESELSYQTRELQRALRAGAHKPLYWNNDGIALVAKTFAELTLQAIKNTNMMMHNILYGCDMQSAADVALPTENYKLWVQRRLLIDKLSTGDVCLDHDDADELLKFQVHIPERCAYCGCFLPCVCMP